MIRNCVPKFIKLTIKNYFPQPLLWGGFWGRGAVLGDSWVVNIYLEQLSSNLVCKSNMGANFDYLSQISQTQTTIFLKRNKMKKFFFKFVKFCCSAKPQSFWIILTGSEDLDRTMQWLSRRSWAVCVIRWRHETSREFITGQSNGNYSTDC